MKRVVAIVFLALFLFAAPFFYLVNYSQTINLADHKVVYDLPYPGILPNHPLYFVKVTRDFVLDFLTRDNIKKAQLYLMYSDKRANMSIFLAKEGKNSLAVTTLSKAEKYALKIPPLLRQSKEQGVSPSNDFVSRVKLSNQKHKEVITDLFKSFPQGDQQGFDELLKLNAKVADDLKKL